MCFYMIDLTNMIYENTKMFAIYDTTNDTFKTVNRNNVWDDWKDFKFDYFKDEMVKENVELDRFYNLIKGSKFLEE